MKSESAPILDVELLIRRVHRDRFKTDRNPIISTGAFEPRVKGEFPDFDGISLYRLDCLHKVRDALLPVAEEKRGDQALVAVSVGFVKSLGLTVVPKHDDAVLGHVVVPELNATDYPVDKKRFTPILKALAEEASKTVLLRPGDEPDAEESD